MENKDRSVYFEEMKRLAEEARKEINPRQTGEYRTPGVDVISGEFIISGRDLNNLSRYRGTDNPDKK